jgi:phage terminase small subunit
MNENEREELDYLRTNQQELFIEQYCLSGNATKAAEVAGYSHPKQRGHELKKRYELEIEERTKKMIMDCVPGALSQLKTLSQDAESESVRFQATRDILDRAGLKPTEKVKTEISHVETASTDELRRELEALTGSSSISEIPELVN